ncbi:MAG: hypothetical protein LCH61_20455 [Proteobacteria bacterium]|nr:hypothetical protein [Pseudomonadota bacterium]
MMRISDHALIRFLDRVAGLDVEGLRATLALSLDRAHRAAESLGAADYTVKADGLVYVVRDGVLVTVLGPAGGST